MKIYIMCNPQYEQDRISFLQRHFESRGIPWSSVCLVHDKWGSELSAEEIFEAWDPFIHRFGEQKQLCYKAACMTRGEVSVCLAFSKLIDVVLKDESSTDLILVFESDIVLREDFKERLDSVLKEVGDRPWDYISLSEGVGTRIPECEGRSYFAPMIVKPAPHMAVFRCCDAMLFRRSFLEKLRKTFLPVRECLDWWMNVQIQIHGGKALWVDPPLAEQGSNRGRVGTYLPS